MKINYEIYKQAKNKTIERDRLQAYLQTCFRVRICPKCGESGLKKYINNEGFVEGIDYDCTHCGWEWSSLTEEE